MITVIRERLIKNNAYKVVVWIVLFVFIVSMFWVPGMVRKMASGGWVVQVNGQEVEAVDFYRKEQFFDKQLTMLRQQLGANADLFFQAQGISLDSKKLAFDAVVREALLNQACERLDLQVGDDYIHQKLADVMFVNRELSDIVPWEAIDPVNGINPMRLQSYLRKIHLSLTDFEEKVRQAILRSILDTLLTGAIFVPEFELREQFKTNYLGKRFSILVFPLETYLRQEKNKTANDEDLKAFFDTQASQGNYWVAEKRSGTVWHFDAKSYNIEVSDAEINEYYESHKGKDYVDKPAQVEVRTIVFKIPKDGDEAAIRAKAQEVRATVVAAPETFAQKATELSEDKLSGRVGGLLPRFGKGTHEAAFERAAYLLANNGDISDVIKTAKGFEILQRVERIPATYKPVSAVRDEIRRRVINNKFIAQFENDISGLMGKDDAALQEFAAQKKARSERLANVSRDAKERASKDLFDLTVNELSYYTQDGIGTVVKLNSIEKRHLPDLASVRAQVLEDFNEMRAQRALKAALNKARNELTTKSLQEIAKEMGLSVRKTDMISARQEDKIKALAKEGLPIQEMLQIEKVGSVGTYETGRDGYLARLDEQESFNENEFTAKKAELEKQLKQERGLFLGEGFVASLYRTATIKPNESLIA